MKIQALVSFILLGLFPLQGFTADAASSAKKPEAEPLSANEQVSIKLEELDKVKSQEKGGDELFFSITEYPKNSPAKHYQVPSFPSHWVSDYFSSLKDIVLWQKDMNVCEPTEVIFSLVEEDLMPWDIDDLIGSAKLKINCEDGKMVSEWVVPNPGNTAQETSEDKNTVFMFKGDGAEYRATLQFDKSAVETGKKAKEHVSEKVKK